MRGSHLLMSIANKNRARAAQKENKVQFKALLPLQLRNRVSGKNDSEKEKGCLHEISLAMACLAKNNYQNTPCAKEINNFNNCFKTYMKNKETRKENQLKGILTVDAKTLNHREVNILLKRFP
ncbi:uncharacterized protein LOC122498009 [Leptopilina heterotoma]|uniref:uncharacterized protein LOC122498009 n=1 Tax=Leptopilina heterotoma TaxID=63436 RepID=UPI001CA8AB71|nr:uncharacterized protein LOC122498009 [Leptopilina heterotoma]